MNQRKWVNATLALALVVSLALPGCVVAPDQGHYADGVVLVAPPAVRVEVIGVPPVAGSVWIAGYWDWVGGRHVWVPGRWVPGKPRHHWVAARWIREGDGWRMQRGHWARD